mmetsp:Transcript_116731/g.376750  ORF Transcript_116731/g.376750 Transcript_116731/m.376750 type:complete len:301 (+) Transcript_116731:629-1531(+)
MGCVLWEEAHIGQTAAVHVGRQPVRQGFCARVVVADGEDERHKPLRTAHGTVPAAQPVVPGRPTSGHAIVVGHVSADNHGSRRHSARRAQSDSHELRGVRAAAHVTAEHEADSVAVGRRSPEAPVRQGGDVGALALDGEPVLSVGRQPLQERAVHVPAALPEVVLREADCRGHPPRAAGCRCQGRVAGRRRLALRKDTDSQAPRGHVHVHEDARRGVLRQREVDVAGHLRVPARVAAGALPARPARRDEGRPQDAEERALGVLRVDGYAGAVEQQAQRESRSAGQRKCHEVPLPARPAPL